MSNNIVNKKDEILATINKVNNLKVLNNLNFEKILGSYLRIGNNFKESEIKNAVQQTLVWFTINRNKLQDCKALDVLQQVGSKLQLGAIVGRDYYIYNQKGYVTAPWRWQGVKRIIKEFSADKLKGDLIYNVVFEGDEFEEDKLSGKVIKHTSKLENRKNDINKIVGAYAMAIFQDGSHKCYSFGKDEILARKKASKTTDGGVWNSWPIEMVLAKIIKKLSEHINLNFNERQRLAFTDDEGIIKNYDVETGATEIIWDESKVIENPKKNTNNEQNIVEINKISENNEQLSENNEQNIVFNGVEEDFNNDEIFIGNNDSEIKQTDPKTIFITKEQFGILYNDYKVKLKNYINKMKITKWEDLTLFDMQQIISS